VLSAGYETNLTIPHNAAGRTAAKELADWGRGEGKDSFNAVKEETLTRDLGGLKEALKGSRAKTVGGFLTAHGSADEKGVYLVPQDADLKDRTKSRVYLEDIFKQLAALPSGSKKLLILDATQVTASWTLGLFHNDLARQLKGLEEQIKGIPGL